MNTNMVVAELTETHQGWLIEVDEPEANVVPHRTFVLGKGFKVGVRHWTRPDGTDWVGLCDETDKRPGVVGTERHYPASTMCRLIRPVTPKAKRAAKASGLATEVEELVKRPAMKRAVPAPLTPSSIDKATAKSIVFGSTLARSVLITETPETVVQLTAERIWANFETFFALGEWPVKP